MFFDSVIYFVFLIVVVAAYWRLRTSRQNVMLLCASYLFYGWWDWRFLILMAISTLVDYYLANRIARETRPAARRTALTISLLMNFGFLGVFKYFNFFVSSAQDLARVLGAGDFTLTLIEIALPPGISFYTFQAVAYIVDVYFGKLKPARSLITYALFISLFPHLIAGPIQRPDHLLPQVERDRVFEPNKVFDGLMLIATGLFRKVVVADNCALIANAAFAGTFGVPSLPVLLIGTYAFAWQIYGDFSGYSDIARGSAQLMGFHFMVNFRQPYLATGLSDFWRRWHVSLSTWLRDYLYIPLGGNRLGERRTYVNLAATMLLGGLWHGANWTFVIWGAIHGFGLGIERKLRGPNEGKERLSFAKRWVFRIVLFQFVCLAWIFFRATSLGEAVHLLRGAAIWDWRPEYWTALQFLAFFSIPLFLIDLRIESAGEEYPFERVDHRRLIPIGAVALLLVALFGASQSGAFIYFQF
jgi:D-alanyl-lipoteichoic acid acyltransferase DltB (MBOAT superfamily)